jgi:predicted AAA+ superfamily ATPase
MPLLLIIICNNFESVKKMGKLEIEYVPAWKWLLQSQN